MRIVPCWLPSLSPAQGAKVLAHYNRSSERLQPLQKEANGRLVAVQADLRSEDDNAKLFKDFPCQVLVGE